MQIRPASPKYDERSFFYTTPALHPKSPGKPPSKPPLLKTPAAATHSSSTSTHSQRDSSVARQLQTPVVTAPGNAQTDMPPPTAAAAAILNHRGLAASPWRTPLGRAAPAEDAATAIKQPALSAPIVTPGGDLASLAQHQICWSGPFRQVQPACHAAYAYGSAVVNFCDQMQGQSWH